MGGKASARCQVLAAEVSLGGEGVVGRAVQGEVGEAVVAVFGKGLSMMQLEKARF